jgi:hypothetical protein
MKQFLIVILAFLSISLAKSYPYTHDGFFLNFALGPGIQGFGYNGYVEGADGHFSDADGGSLEFEMKIGGRVLPYTVLHVTYAGIGPMSDNGEMMYLLGLGATYYIRPYNFFVGGTLGSSQFSTGLGASDYGFGFQILGGKEWWVSENWGIGTALSLTYGTASDYNGRGSVDLSAFSVNLLFSATFN